MQTLDLSDRNNMFYWQTNRKITAQQQKEVFLDRFQMVKSEEAKDAIEYGMGTVGKSNRDRKVVELSEPIEFGSVNTVRRATLADGTKLVVRMHPHFVKNGYFWVEGLATAEAKKLGVPVYDTYLVDDTMDKFTFAYMIMSALPGKTLKEYTDDPHFLLTEQLVRETGRNVAKIHQLKPNGFGYFNNEIAQKDKQLVGQYAEFKQHIFAGLEEDLEFLVGNGVLQSEKAAQITELFEQNTDLMKCEVASLIHNDVADWNEVSDGNHVTGMVDWDECFAGDPVMDFSAYSLFYGGSRMDWFKAGYQEISTLPESFEEKFQLYKLRYLISKLHLRKKRLMVYKSENLEILLTRGLEAMSEVFGYFKV